MAIRRILVPVDFSPSTCGTVRTASELAVLFDAQLILLHVVDEARLTRPYERVLQPFDSLVKETLGNPAEWGTAEHPAVRTVVILGRPDHEVVRYALDHAVDLIVMSTHGRAAGSRHVLGSVTKKVLRRAPCPVLCVSHRLVSGGDLRLRGAPLKA